MLLAESRAERENPHLWHEIVSLMDRLGLVIDQRRHQWLVTRALIGIFPRSYDVVMPDYRGLMTELAARQSAASLQMRSTRVS